MNWDPAVPLPHPRAVKLSSTLSLGAIALLGGFLLSWLGYALTLRPAGVVFLWPPSGIVLATLLLVRRERWLPIVVGAFAGNALTDFLHGAAPGLALSGSATNTAEQLLAATVVLRLAGAESRPTSLRSFGALLVGGVLASNAITALAGALVLSAYSTQPFWHAWLNWWAGDGMGMLILTPAVVTSVYALRSARRPTGRQLLELAACLGAVVLVGSLLLGGTRTQSDVVNSLAFLVYPFLIVAGLRLGPWGASVATLALTAVAASYAVNGRFAVGGEAVGATRQVFDLYIYLALGAISALLPAAVLDDQRETAGALQASEGRFRQIADNVNEVFFVVDLKTFAPVYVSPRWATIWGRPIEEASDPKIWFDAIHPDDQQAMRDAQAANASGENTETEFRIRRPDGSLRSLRGRAFPIRNPGTGAVESVVGLAEDVTELRSVEQKFVQAQKLEAVGRLAGGVAHDFNNLLTVIYAETELLLATELPGTIRGAVTEIRDTAQSAAGLTRQLLTFSRRNIPEALVFDINATVTNISTMLRRLIGEDIELDLRLDPQPLTVRADRGQIEQVVTNLVVNARDALPRGGIVLIETTGSDEVNGGWVTLSVRDTGTGMPDEVIASAFEPFFTTKALGRGTGLGLATCKDIVTLAGGRISISSRVGVGTTVRVDLPRVATSGAGVDSAKAEALPGGSERILLVEDETGVRKATARLLRARGYDVLEARDGPDALRLLADSRGKVDMLLTDVVLPGMNGPELAQRIHEALPQVKTLFASGYTGEAAPEELVEATRAHLLAKPFTSAELAKRVRQTLDGGSTPNSG